MWNPFEFFPSYRPKRDLSKSLWRDSGSDDLNEDGCTGEKEYCEIVDACVDDCDLFQTKDDSTPFVIVCKEGLVSLKWDFYGMFEKKDNFFILEYTTYVT